MEMANFCGSQFEDSAVIIHVLSRVLTQLIEVNQQSNTRQHVTKFQSSYAPGISILGYLERINKHAKCSPNCFIVALIYIDRLIEIRNVVLTSLNVHRILITSVLLSTKVFDDEFYKNAYYAKLGGVSTHEMNALELEFLTLVNYNLFVSTETFAKYQHELHSFMSVPPPPSLASRPSGLSPVHSMSTAGMSSPSLSTNSSFPMQPICDSIGRAVNCPPSARSPGCFAPVCQQQAVSHNSFSSSSYFSSYPDMSYPSPHAYTGYHSGQQQSSMDGPPVSVPLSNGSISSQWPTAGVNYGPSQGPSPQQPPVSAYYPNGYFTPTPYYQCQQALSSTSTPTSVVDMFPAPPFTPSNEDFRSAYARQPQGMQHLKMHGAGSHAPYPTNNSPKSVVGQSGLNSQHPNGFVPMFCSTVLYPTTA